MNGTSIAAAGFVGLLVASGANYTAESFNPGAEGLYVKSFAYEDGKFTQVIGSISGSKKSGKWTAEVSRTIDGTTTQLCAGSGVGVYDGSPQTYGPDDWTGDICPPLLPSDEAEATWEYTNESGLTQTISVDLALP